MSEAFEAKAKAAVAPGPDRAMAGVQFIAANRDGIQYARTFGQTGLDASSPPMAEDSVVWLASCTKLITSLCALQCLERSLFTLDEPASHLLPELKNVGILAGFEDPETQMKPIIRESETAITLRMLLTHTSGFGYAFMVPSLLAAAKAVGADYENTGSMDLHFKTPLLFPPGTGWAYSASLDWAGLLVARATGLRLGDYMKANIFEPLGIKDLTFNVVKRPDMAARVMPTAVRGEDGVLGAGPAAYTQDAVDELGGGGLWGTAGEYFKVLQAILREDAKILKEKSSWDSLYKVQIEDPQGPMTINMVYAQYDKNCAEIVGAEKVPEGGIKWGHGLVSAIAMSDVPGWCRKGTITWGGMQNNSWWVDRESGVVSFMNTQVLPYEDPGIVRIKGAFHGEMLRLFAK